MTEIVLDASLNEARDMVVRAFDATRGIEKYQQSHHQVVGETGVSFPRVLWSYGESVYVDLSETGQLDRTKIEVRAEKEVSLNVGADPEKYKRRFLDELNSLRDQSITTSRSDGQIPTASPEDTDSNSSNGTPIDRDVVDIDEPIPTADPDVDMEEGSGSGTSTLMVIIAVTMLVFFGMWFLMMLSMPY